MAKNYGHLRAEHKLLIVENNRDTHCTEESSTDIKECLTEQWVYMLQLHFNYHGLTRKPGRSNSLSNRVAAYLISVSSLLRTAIFCLRTSDFVSAVKRIALRKNILVNVCAIDRR